MKRKRSKTNLGLDKVSLLNYEDAWGCIVDDVKASVDWTSLTKAFDELTATSSCSPDFSWELLREKLILQAKGPKTPVLACIAFKEKGRLPLPVSFAEHPLFAVSSRMALQSISGKGFGWVATATIPTGTIVLVEKPVLGLMNLEFQGKKWCDCAGSDTAALGIRLAKCFSGSLEPILETLHPRLEAPSEEQEEDNSDDDYEERLALEEDVARAWAHVSNLSESKKKRLQQVVHLNSLGFYTNSEQLCHHENFSVLTGVGLYILSSGFNHSCDPAVSRFSIGDITVFVTNRIINVGEELCISYFETELLCAPKSLRCQSLNRDFTCSCKKCVADLGEEEVDDKQKQYLHVDCQVQAQLALLMPADRVKAVESALRGEMGEEDEEEDEEEEDDEEGDEEKNGPAIVLGKDAQELRVVQALALMQMNQHEESLAVWRKLAAFACHHCPPFDESLVVYALQSTLCALTCGSDSATVYASIAVNTHRVSCGVPLLKWRFQKEIELSKVSDSIKDTFWKLIDNCDVTLDEWSSLILAWKFEPDEIPEAQTDPNLTAAKS